MIKKKYDNESDSFVLGLFILSLIIIALKFVLDFGGAKNTVFLSKAGLILLIISVVIAILKYVIKRIISKKKSEYNTIIDANYKSIEEELEKIDIFTGIQFEQYIMALLKKEGYSNIESTKVSGDYGVDIIAIKDDLKCAIQCKRYHNNIPIKAIQEIKAGKTYYKCDKAMVITNSYYTQNAKNLASSAGVQLFDRDDLIRIVKKHNNK